MKQPVAILIRDVGQARRDSDNLIRITVADPATKLPYMKIELSRIELAKLMTPKFIGHLNDTRLDGFLVT